MLAPLPEGKSHRVVSAGNLQPPPHPGQGRGQPQSHATSAWTLLERDVSSSPRPPPTPKQPHCAEAFIILGTPSLPGGGDLAQPLMCPCEPGWAIGGEFPKWARRGGKSVPAAHSRSPPWGGGSSPRGRPRHGLQLARWMAHQVARGLHPVTHASSASGLPVLCPGVRSPGAGGLLEIPQPHPGERPPSHSQGYLGQGVAPPLGRDRSGGNVLCLKGGTGLGLFRAGLGPELPGKREQMQASALLTPGPSALPSAGP